MEFSINWALSSSSKNSNSLSVVKLGVELFLLVAWLCFGPFKVVKSSPSSNSANTCLLELFSRLPFNSVISPPPLSSIASDDIDCLPLGN